MIPQNLGTLISSASLCSPKARPLGKRSKASHMLVTSSTLGRQSSPQSVLNILRLRAGAPPMRTSVIAVQVYDSVQHKISFAFRLKETGNGLQYIDLTPVSVVE